MSERKYVVYESQNTVNGKLYIGKSFKNRIEKGYRGSGFHLKNAFKTYGKENFTARILSEHNSEQEAYEEELRVILERDAVNSENYYNIVAGDYRMTLSGKDHPNHGKHYHSKEFKQMVGKTLHSPENRQKWDEMRAKNKELYGNPTGPNHSKLVSKAQRSEKNAKSVPILIINRATGEENRYPSMRQASEAIGMYNPTLRKILRNQVPENETYEIKYATDITTTGGVTFTEEIKAKMRKSKPRK